MTISENPSGENSDIREELKPETIHSRLSALMDETNAGPMARCGPRGSSNKAAVGLVAPPEEIMGLS